MTKVNKKRNRPKNKNGLVKREAFPQESNKSKLKKGKKKKKTKELRKKRRKTKGKKNRKRKKTKRKGNSRQGESGAPDGSDVRTRQVWPWMVGSINCVQYQIKPANESNFSFFIVSNADI